MRPIIAQAVWATLLSILPQILRDPFSRIVPLVAFTKPTAREQPSSFEAIVKPQWSRIETRNLT